MRGSAWLLPIVALIVWIASIGFPALAAWEAILNQPRTDIEIRATTQLLMTSLGWAAAVAVGAIILGWAPGQVLGRALHGRGFVPLAVLMLVPICLPAYVVFYAWYQSWPPDSGFYRWLIAHDQATLARHATLYLGLACWSWPLVSWTVAGRVAMRPVERDELLRLDGAGRARRFIDRLRSDSPGLALGGLLVFLTTLNNTTCFDLAEVFTFANELRAIAAVGATARDVLGAGIPAIVIAAAGAAAVWFLFHPSRDRPPTRVAQLHPATGTVAGSIWIVSVLLPMILFSRGVLTSTSESGMVSEFLRLYGRSLINTVLLSCASGLIGASVAVGLAMMWMDHRRWVRLSAHAMAVMWLFTAILPGTIIGLGLQTAYNREALGLSEVIYSTPIILILGHLASFGFVAALIARWAASDEPRELADLRRLDGAQTLPGLVIACRPRFLAVSAASLAIIAVLSMGEIPVTAQVNPPLRAGSEPLAVSLLSDMHYQRPRSVLMAVLFIIAGAVGVATVTAIGWHVVRRSGYRTVRQAVVLLSVLVAVSSFGCVPDDSDFPAPLKTRVTFGTAGRGLGQFGYPRAIDVDPDRQYLYIIDKTARVQRFGLNGEPHLEWTMPEWEYGKPTGISVAPDGRVFVADTHYFRVIAFDSEGRELMRFGEYGTGPGQFILPTDVAFGPDGRLYVSEYGGNDRVQVFSATGEYLFEFGSFGAGRGQFNRPQALAFNADQTELYIADSVNHRIVVVDPQGTVVRTFGSAGRDAGQLAFSYGVIVLADGTLLVCEFGNNRLQRFDREGQSLGVFGRVGRGDGELQFPWAVTATADRVFVLDSGNNRVQVVEPADFGVRQ